MTNREPKHPPLTRVECAHQLSEPSASANARLRRRSRDVEHRENAVLGPDQRPMEATTDALPIERIAER